jgi:peptide/nickel transport system ATP-binding protein
VSAVLEVRDLAVTFGTREGELTAVDSVTLTVERGQVLGLVGESGSGKSVTGLAIMGLIDPPGRIAGGSIRFDGRELVGLAEPELRALRGRHVAMIFQDPMTTLNPVLRIDTQMIEAVRAHERVSEAAARARAVEALSRVGIPSPQERLTAYPHQFSGGMRQRVAIAIALLHGPALLVADEPTTALDVTIQAQILAEVQQLCAETGTALVWITHDLAVVAGLADRVAVMYAGRIAEIGPSADVLASPQHPYTQGLLAAIPRPATPRGQLAAIPGSVPQLIDPPAQCHFASRCSFAGAACHDVTPDLLTIGDKREVSCLRFDSASRIGVSSADMPSAAKVKGKASS